MAKILLDYFMPIATVESTPAASTAFLKQACVVAKPKSGQESNVGQVFACTSMSQVAARTDNDNAQQLFNAGMSKVYVLLADDLDLTETLEAAAGDFYTLLISDDFEDADLETVPVPAVKASRKIQDILYTAVTPGLAGNDITISYVDTNSDGEASVTVTGTDIEVSIEAGVTTAQAIADAIEEDDGEGGAATLVTVAVDVGDETDPQVVTGDPVSLQNGEDADVQAGDIDVGAFEGVIGYSSPDAETCALFGTGSKRCGFYGSEANGAKSMFYAFGKLLSNPSNWINQQYIAMPVNDGVATLGDANSMFDDRVSFVIHDDEFGNRLALFAAGGKAIVAPYIEKNLRVDLQSRALQWISANQPQFTLTNAALLEQRLVEDVINQKYIQTQWIEAGVVSVKLVQDNFVANAAINITEPTALWRIFGEMRTSL